MPHASMPRDALTKNYMCKIVALWNGKVLHKMALLMWTWIVNDWAKSWNGQQSLAWWFCLAIEVVLPNKHEEPLAVWSSKQGWGRWHFPNPLWRNGFSRFQLEPGKNKNFWSLKLKVPLHVSFQGCSCIGVVVVWYVFDNVIRCFRCSYIEIWQNCFSKAGFLGVGIKFGFPVCFTHTDTSIYLCIYIYRYICT